MNSKNILRSSLSRASIFIIFLLLFQTFAAAEEENWNWLKAEDLEIKGTGWPDSSETFTRLPNRAKEIVRPPVWNLSRDSTGLYIDFTTESPALRVRWSLFKERLEMNHMPATGVSGLDLYYRHEDKWRFVAVGRPTGPDSNEVTFFENLPEEKREFRLYLPLYNGLESLELGIPAGQVLKAVSAKKLKPIIVYGTSIVQGGCASRPGMAYPAILGRRFEHPFINLGFSGNGRAESEIAELIAELDPALFILDPLPNIGSEEVGERLENFVRILRSKHPRTPILLVENVTYPTSILFPERAERIKKSNARLNEVFKQRVEEGDENLFYHRTENLLGKDGEDTVDGVHPTDLGFLRMADGLEPVVRKILSQSQ